jgi:ribA/ribD-fused uncharacterized protein
LQKKQQKKLSLKFLENKMSEIIKNGFVLFWGGYLSQWYMSEMEIDGCKYNCCEQWMMAEKARKFNDLETLKAIMKSSSPRDQKALGRKIKDFDVQLWNSICREVVYRGNLAKFSQNQELKQRLLATADLTLVEASPYDKVWGIGLSADDPRAAQRSQWQGTNWLGEAIMQVRKELQ